MPEPRREIASRAENTIDCHCVCDSYNEPRTQGDYKESQTTLPADAMQALPVLIPNAQSNANTHTTATATSFSILTARR
jgi:hypothetical protein